MRRDGNWRVAGAIVDMMTQWFADRAGRDRPRVIRPESFAALRPDVQPRRCACDELRASIAVKVSSDDTDDGHAAAQDRRAARRRQRHAENGRLAGIERGTIVLAVAVEVGNDRSLSGVCDMRCQHCAHAKRPHDSANPASRSGHASQLVYGRRLLSKARGMRASGEDLVIAQPDRIRAAVEFDTSNRSDERNPHGQVGR